VPAIGAVMPPKISSGCHACLRNCNRSNARRSSLAFGLLVLIPPVMYLVMRWMRWPPVLDGLCGWTPDRPRDAI
jgi:hypothetical protein